MPADREKDRVDYQSIESLTLAFYVPYCCCTSPDQTEKWGSGRGEGSFGEMAPFAGITGRVSFPHRVIPSRNILAIDRAKIGPLIGHGSIRTRPLVLLPGFVKSFLPLSR